MSVLSNSSLTTWPTGCPNFTCWPLNSFQEKRFFAPADVIYLFTSVCLEECNRTALGLRLAQTSENAFEGLGGTRGPAHLDDSTHQPQTGSDEGPARGFCLTALLVSFSILKRMYISVLNFMLSHRQTGIVGWKKWLWWDTGATWVD